MQGMYYGSKIIFYVLQDGCEFLNARGYFEDLWPEDDMIHPEGRLKGLKAWGFWL